MPYEEDPASGICVTSINNKFGCMTTMDFPTSKMDYLKVDVYVEGQSAHNMLHHPQLFEEGTLQKDDPEERSSTRHGHETPEADRDQKMQIAPI